MSGLPYRDDERGLARQPAEVSPAQLDAIREITAGPRGEFSGPFVPLLRIPGVMTHLQRAGAELRFHSGLAQHLVEMVVLLVARHWDQHFEWSAHCDLALRAGLPEVAVRAIANGRRPGELGPDGIAVWRLVSELLTRRDVSDATYEEAIAALGEVGTVEIVTTAGYYTTLAMVLNTARTAPVRPATIPLPAPHRPDRETPPTH